MYALVPNAAIVADLNQAQIGSEQWNRPALHKAIPVAFKWALEHSATSGWTECQAVPSCALPPTLLAAAQISSPDVRASPAHAIIYSNVRRSNKRHQK